MRQPIVPNYISYGIKVKYKEKKNVLDQTYVVWRMNGYFGGHDLCPSTQY